jgi:hypothetical protein
VAGESADRVGPAKPALVRYRVLMAAVVNINEVLDGHVGLDLECVDRLYLNMYVPNLQVGGQVVQFLTGHRGNKIPSPALFNQIGNRFRKDVHAFAEENDIPILKLKKPDRTRWDDRKLDHVRPYMDAAEREGRFRRGRHPLRPGVPVGVLGKEPLRGARGQLRVHQVRAPLGHLLLLGPSEERLQSSELGHPTTEIVH